MKRQSKKQWCYYWMESFGKPELSQKFYEYIGGKGPRPKLWVIENYKLIVEKTMKFFDEIK
jgi:hypothetical protein